MELGKSDEKLNIENTDTMNNKGIKICDECGSEFLVGSSKIYALNVHPFYMDMKTANIFFIKEDV